jgi:hypothetical protein
MPGKHSARRASYHRGWPRDVEANGDIAHARWSSRDVGHIPAMARGYCEVTFELFAKFKGIDISAGATGFAQVQRPEIALFIMPWTPDLKFLPCA